MRRKEFCVKKGAQWQLRLTLVSSKAEGLLSPKRAFVAQFRKRREAERERLAGWVEHTMSRDAACFDSLEELLTFFTRVRGSMA